MSSFYRTRPHLYTDRQHLGGAYLRLWLELWSLHEESLTGDDSHILGKKGSQTTSVFPALPCPSSLPFSISWCAISYTILICPHCYHHGPWLPLFLPCYANSQLVSPIPHIPLWSPHCPLKYLFKKIHMGSYHFLPLNPFMICFN